MQCPRKRYERVAELVNNIADRNEFPELLEPSSILRPIILLSILRKCLPYACFREHLGHFREILPLGQTAHKREDIQKRLQLNFKLVVKAIASWGYHPCLMVTPDVSQHRGSLLEPQSYILEIEGHPHIPCKQYMKSNTDA